MPSPDPLTLPLQERLQESIIAWLGTAIGAGADPDGSLEAARQYIVANLVIMRRDEDGPITPETEAAKKLRLIVAASDEGRTAIRAPIRNVRARLVVRGNGLVDAGKIALFLEAAGAVEKLIDGMNLQTSWTSSTWKVAAMLAVRGTNSRVAHGNLRAEAIEVNVKAVGLEHTS